MPSYSETQIKAAFAACTAQAEQVAETKQQFPIPTLEVAQPAFAEQLETCVLWTLEGKRAEMTLLD